MFLRVTEKDFTLLKDWSYFTSPNPTGWWASEKIWDVRVMFCGKYFWTRGGLRVNAPAWFTKDLPTDLRLDGGLYAGRSGFNEARSAANHGRFTSNISFQIYDVPQAPGTWAERIAVAPTLPHAAPVAFWPVLSKQHLVSSFHEIRRGQGEGVVIRCPQAVGYQRGRSNSALRLKDFNA